MLRKPLSLPMRLLGEWAGGRVEIANAASLRPALASLNHRILTLAVVPLSGLLPSITQGSLDRRMVALAVEGALCLALFALRSQLRGQILEQWEITMQGILRSTLLPDTAAACSRPLLVAHIAD